MTPDEAFRTYARSLSKIVRGPWQQVDEAISDTFLEISLRPELLEREEASVLSMLIRMTRCNLKDIFKAESRRNLLETRAIGRRVGDHADDISVRDAYQSAVEAMPKKEKEGLASFLRLDVNVSDNREGRRRAKRKIIEYLAA